MNTASSSCKHSTEKTYPTRLNSRAKCGLVKFDFSLTAAERFDLFKPLAQKHNQHFHSFVLRHSKLHVSKQCDAMELQIFIFKSLKNSNSFQIKDEFKSRISSYCTCRFSPFIILLQLPTIALPSKSPSISTQNRQNQTFTLPFLSFCLGQSSKK
jgi:hypothetical protein